MGVWVAELATVRIHRPTLWMTAGFAVVIEVDGREVGRLRNGQNLATYVEPGRHNLRAQCWSVTSVPLELDLAPGEDLRLETRFESLATRLMLVRTEPVVAVPPVRPDIQVLGATEMHRSEEPIGTENLWIDNTPAAARLTRTMRVTRQWSRTVSLDLQDIRDDSAGTVVGSGLAGVADQCGAEPVTQILGLGEPP